MMDRVRGAILLTVLLAGCLGGYEAGAPELGSEQRPTTPLCVNCPKTTTTRRTTTHSTQPTTTVTTAHTNHTTAPPTTAHTNHTTAPHTTAHTNHTTAPHTTAHTNHTTSPHTTAHTNHTTVPHTTAHTNHTTAPPTTAHTNHTTAPHTTAHSNHTTAPHTTAHSNHTTAPHTTAHTNHTTAPHTTAHSNHTTAPHTTAHTNHTTAPHTTVPPHTTQHSNHTIGPYTTAHPNHTESHTTQHPTPEPTPTEYFVNGTSGVCLRIQATFVLAFNITKPVNYTIPPPPATKASGVCAQDTAELQLDFTSGALSLTFMKDKKENMYFLGNISLIIHTSQGVTVMQVSQNAMKTPIGRSFTCKDVNVELVDTRVMFLDIKVQAFELEGGNFGREMNCTESDGSRSKTVPIVVGIVLLVLIVIVVVAYLIGRKKKPSGYERL